MNDKFSFLPLLILLILGAAQSATSNPTMRTNLQVPGSSNDRHKMSLVQGNSATGVGHHPHPLAASKLPASFAGHYYLGSSYTGSAQSATDLATAIPIPDDQPQTLDFYYVILSVWDDAGSYDQIGFTNDYGVWGVAYSTTSYCAGTYNYKADAYDLARGQNFRFDMSILSGYVDFKVTNSTGSIVWNLSQYTGGNHFLVQQYYTCNSLTYYDYTDYEEVYNSTGSVLPYDFLFIFNGGGNSFFTSWTPYRASAPAGTNVLISSGGGVTLENTPYYLTFTNGLDSTVVEPTDAPTTHYWNLSVNDLSPDSPVYITSYYVPNSWIVIFFPSQGNPSYISELSFTVPSTATAGRYYIGIAGSDGTGTYNRIALAVIVLPKLSASLSSTPGSGGVDVGQTVSFYANAEGGTGFYRYQWTSLPAGCQAALTPSIQCTPTSAGSFTVSVMVTDSIGYSQRGLISFSVISDPTVQLIVNTPSLLQGQSVSFAATTQGGNGPYTYVWNGLPPGCTSAPSSPSYSCTPSSGGGYDVIVTVTDANGMKSNATVHVEVDPSFLGLPAIEGYGVASLIVAFAAILALVASLRLKPKKMN